MPDDDTDSELAAWVAGLVAGVPELRPLLQDHEERCDEVLAYVFLADVVRAFVGDSLPRNALARLFAACEVALEAGSIDVQRLVEFGVVENLPAPYEVPTMYLCAGTRLRQVWDRQWGGQL